MSVSRRIFFGALLGALIVLAAHPAARPYIGQGLWELGPSRFLARTESLPENLSRLPQPESLGTAALWLLVASERDAANMPLNPSVCRRLTAIAQAGAKREPDNAFWRQMASVMLGKLGDIEGAQREWDTAAQAARWNDYQGARLDRLLDGLKAESGRPMGWHYAFTYSRRSTAPARMIYRHGRMLLSKATSQPRSLLDVRLDTLRNGQLLRDGARLNDASAFGMSLIEASAFPYLPESRSFEDLTRGSPRKRLLARYAFVRELQARHAEAEVEQVMDAFNTNESWIALIDSQAPADHTRLLAIVSVASASLPGTLLLVALFGWFINLVGMAMDRWPKLQFVFKVPAAPILGVLLGGATYLWTRLPFPAVWIAVVFGCFAVTPDKIKDHKPRDLGDAFRLTMGIVAACIGLVTMLFFAGISKPGVYLLHQLGVADSYGSGSTALLALVAVLLGLVLASASAWAFVQQHRPNELAPIALRVCGAYIGVTAVTLAVLVAPVAIGLDRHLSDTLAKVLQNEPTYFLTR